eukprot:9496909-Pyramimonas_sp.AAC.1
MEEKEGAWRSQSGRREGQKSKGSGERRRIGRREGDEEEATQFNVEDGVTTQRGGTGREATQ